MKITDIVCTLLRIPHVRPVADGTQDTLVVEVHTDEGIVGLGEAHTSPWVAMAVIDAPLSHVMARGLRDVLIGTDPLAINARWDDMYRYTQVFGRRGVVVHAISAIDIALWDIVGKALDHPIHALLGGARRERVPAYASVLALETPDDTRARARELAGDGFRAMKFGWSQLGRDVDADAATIEAVRDDVGRDIEIMLDIGIPMAHDDAHRLASALGRSRVAFLEEPLSPDDVEGYARLRSVSPVPLAAGEKETTRWGFKALVDAGAVDVLQPDIARAGGLTETRRIAEYAALHGVRVVPHCWSTDILVAATTHFLAAHHEACPLEFCIVDTPLRNDVARDPIQSVDGYVRVPDGPGLGVELNHDTIQRYTFARSSARQPAAPSPSMHPR